MTELFDPKQVESKSPRLRWMEKHGVAIRKHMLDNEWCVWHYEGNEPLGWWVDGGLKNETEIDNCLIRLARNNHWKTWLEEGWENE